jgi:ATP-dependent Zn protease
MKTLKNFAIIIFIFLALAVFFSLSQTNSQKSKEVGVSDFVAKVRNGEVSAVVVSDSKLEFTTTENEKFVTKKENSDYLSELLKNYEVPADKIKDLKV